MKADDAVAEMTCFRIPFAVAGAHVANVLRGDRDTATSPETAASGNEESALFGGDVIREEGEGHAAAALRSGGVDDAVLDVQRVRFGVGWEPLLRGFDVFAGCGVDGEQAAVPT